MPISPPTTTLATIQQKVRRLTRSPSTAQLTDDDLNQYINTFVVYDFPEHLRTFNLRETFTFYTNPYQDVYPTDEISFAGATTNVLYNFRNKYLTVHPPVYIAGYNSLFTQSREQFFGIFPKVNSIAAIAATGNGVTSTFTGVINAAQSIIPPNNFQQQIGLLQNNVLFSAVGNTNQGLALVDVPLVDPTTGYNMSVGNLYVPGFEPATPPTVLDATNFINYATGAFTITFSAPPRAGSTINSQTVPTVLSLPQGVLFFDDSFVVRPVPDQPYRIQIEVFKNPVALLDTAQTPELNEYWQLIAYGASLKIFQDRMDLESVALIQPEYNSQMRLCLRRTIVQLTNQRTATIYTEQTSSTSGYGWNGFGTGNGF